MSRREMNKTRTSKSEKKKKKKKTGARHPGPQRPAAPIFYFLPYILQMTSAISTQNIENILFYIV